MRIRDSWVLEDQEFDEPSDWTIATELKPTTIDEADDDRGFRSLLEDPEACRHWGGSER